MPTPLLSPLFNCLFGTPRQFAKVNAREFDKQLKKLSEIGIFHTGPKDEFVYPIPGCDNSFVCFSKFKELQSTCIEVLGTLPEKQDETIRNFLNYSHTVKLSERSCIKQRLGIAADYSPNPL